MIKKYYDEAPFVVMVETENTAVMQGFDSLDAAETYAKMTERVHEARNIDSEITVMSNPRVIKRMSTVMEYWASEYDESDHGEPQSYDDEF